MNRMALGCAVAAALCLSGCSQGGEGARTVTSPDGRVTVAVGLTDAGALTYRVLHDGAELVGTSPVNLRLSAGGETTRWLRDLTIRSVATREGRDRYTAVGGPQRRVDHPYRAMVVHAEEASGSRRKLDLELRAYDGGAALRLAVPPQPGMATVRIAAEATGFAFPANYACLGVHQKELANSHEGEYAPVAARDLRADGYYDLPLVCRTGRGGETVAIAESGIENYAAAYLVALPDHHPGAAIRLTPHPDDPAVAVKAPMTGSGVASPWRVVMIADRPEALVGSTLVDDLAAPSRIGDAGWIAPGKAVWGWWSGLIARGVANPGHNDATYRHYIDFASRFGLPYYLIDRGWAWRGDGDDPIADITRTADGVNMSALIRYARDRHVRLWLWLNWKALDGRMEEALSLYQRMGVAGIKVDYLYRQDQQMVAFYHRLLASAARHRLMVDIHASFVPRGLRRTYPNFLTEEGVMGVEYNRWSRRDTAKAHVELAYTRAALGPMDYAPGAFRNVSPEEFVARNKAPEVMTTRAHQLALFVVFPSPLAVLADAPAAYGDARGGTAPGAAFVRLVPTAWDETRGIAGEFGRTVAIARRKGRRWYVGVLTDGQARRVALPLDFLSAGQWRVASWCDGDRPDRMATRTGDITAGRGHLIVPMAANGGAALVLEPVS